MTQQARENAKLPVPKFEKNVTSMLKLPKLRAVGMLSMILLPLQFREERDELHSSKRSLFLAEEVRFAAEGAWGTLAVSDGHSAAHWAPTLLIGSSLRGKGLGGVSECLLG